MKERDLYEDFDVFARALVGANDHDPLYPTIKSLLKEKPEYEPEFFIFVYVAFYNLKTAIEFCDRFPTLNHFRAKKKEFMSIRAAGGLRQFGHERRGTCRNPVNQLLLFEGAYEFITQKMKGLRGKSNKKFREAVAGLPFHGNWAAFKIAEIFEKSLGWKELEIKDLGIDERDPNSNDGPVGGLRWLYGREHNYNKSFFPVWNRFGANLSKAYGFGMGEIETICCKAHKMFSGKYFVGHDVMELLELQHVLKANQYERIMSKNFNPIFWKGLKEFPKEKKGVYAKTGKILFSEFGNSVKSVDVRQILLDTE